ncbi:gamma tonoplast intrinsic protein [Actinidia rufa]|uniref:Gamma tonoplast intrinsic protein n=1 Tax=Actinidia rufa TaxID=165716 RepID=A0A7J0GPU8_9ERIC|nr:gamma tonoplast intrinsic protein [Actinidia rufa]
MPIREIAIGRPEEATHPDALKAALAEFFSTLIFVFAGEGSGMAFSKLTNDGSTTPASWPCRPGSRLRTLCCGLRRGQHLRRPRQPGCHFWSLRRWQYHSPPRYYVLDCSAVRVYCGGLLKFATGGLIVMTFGLVYTVYATAIDPRSKGNVGIIAPIAIGFIVGANILAGGAFDGASMNPAVSFGPALVSWDWTNHWVYWAGPLIGGGIAGLVYEVIFISHNHMPLASSEF